MEPARIPFRPAESIKESPVGAGFAISGKDLEGKTTYPRTR
jgi:hypothetical protein